jgi:hypothetical protein
MMLRKSRRTLTKFSHRNSRRVSTTVTGTSWFRCAGFCSAQRLTRTLQSPAASSVGALQQITCKIAVTPDFRTVGRALALAALGRRVAPSDTTDLGRRLGLPPPPSREVILYSKPADARTRRALRTLGAAFAATA